MARTWKIRSNSLLLAHGLLMLCLGVALCSLGSIMSDPEFLGTGYAIAVASTVFGFVVAGGFYWILPQTNGRREIVMNLVVGSSLIGCWLILWLLQSAPSDLLILVLLAGFHGVFWSMWYMRLAFTFQQNGIKASLLCVLAATTSFPGVILATQSEISKLTAVTELAWYAFFIGTQNLMAYMYLYRESGAEAESQAARVLQEAPVAIPSRVPLIAMTVNQGERTREHLPVNAD